MLNKLLSVLSRREYILGLGSLLVLDLGYGFGLNMHFDASGYSLLHFIVLYFIGYGLSNNFIISSKYSGWRYILLYISTLFIMLLLIIFFKDNQWVGRLSSSYASPLVLFGAVSLFSFFANQPIGYRPAINFMSVSMLPVYLIHEGGNVSHWYYQKISTWFKELSLADFILYTIFLVLSLFTLAILIDQPRKWFWKKLQKTISSFSISKAI